jgi:hypothetical protein
MERKMDKKIKKISNDIINGRYVQENIPQMFNYLADQYYDYAQIRLTLHYAAIFGTYCDDEENWSKDGKESLERFNRILAEGILTPENVEIETFVRFIDKLRNEIMTRMNYLTVYTDIFQIYEYILNRSEYRFRQDYEEIDDEKLAKEILRYIFDTRDNMVINVKIREIVGQLPIRMTKQKYLDYLEKSIQSYEGSSESSLNMYLYILRTSSMLNMQKDIQICYPQLWKWKDELSEYKFDTIPQIEYEHAAGILKEATQFLKAETSFYYSLQEIVNETYVMLLCASYIGMTDTEKAVDNEIMVSILKEINDRFMKNDKREPDASFFEKFTALEGVQEALSDVFITTDEALNEADKKYRELIKPMMIEKILNVLLRSRQLLSDSLFIDLNKTCVDNMVNRERITAESGKLKSELTNLFTGLDRMTCHAVMACTLSKMPVFFNNHSEVMDYVRYSIEGCTASYEKAACAEIIKEMIRE